MQSWRWGKVVPILAVCAIVADCTPKTTTNPGPPTAFAVVRVGPTGVRDAGFGGGNGFVTTEIDAGLFDIANAAALQADNKIVTVGTSGLAGQGQIALVRYKPDGSLDTTFGTGGIVKTPIPSVTSNGQAIAIQPDGKIVVAALTYASVSADNTTATTGIALLRYNADGTLDKTGFAAPNGFVTAALGPGTTSDLCSLTLQGTNFIVAGASGNKVFLYRYDTNGVLDTNFGTSGVATTDLGLPALSPFIAIQPADSKIVLAGGQGSFTTQNQPVDQVVLRYTADGSLDTSFNTTGKVVTDIQLLGNFASALVIQGDGKILVAGHALVDFAADSSQISLVRFNTDGTLDTTFGHTGISLTNLGSFDNALSVALQTDSKIIVSGNVSQMGFTNTIAIRYNTDGTADPTFGVSGVVVPPIVGPSNISSANAVLVQPDGNIVFAGYD